MTRNATRTRRIVISGIFILTGLLFLVKLFSLQVLDHDYKLFAANNVLRYITKYPGRGLIYDRNEKLLVYNEAAYDLLVIPKQVKEIDTTELCRLLRVTPDDFNVRLEKAKKHSYYKPSVFLEQISKEEYAYLEEKLYRFPGFYVQARTLRKYPIPFAAHILGYVGEVNKRELELDGYYKQGDYIGKSGIEKTYEKELRGGKGLQLVMVDVFNREKGSYQDGKFDTLAVEGNNLFLTIDTDLQLYGEKLMANKKGSIVAIEPKSGEILAMVSSPAYDPNLLIGRIRTQNFQKLSSDTLEPLFNRPVAAQYPPGSTFKPVNALVGLQEGVLRPSTKYSCNGTSASPIVCSHDHESPLPLNGAIEQSCNPYFWKVYKSIIEQSRFTTVQEGYNHWRDYLLSFNIGKEFDSDIMYQRDGNLPKDAYFNKYYGKKGWKAITVRSLSVGQGEIELTPVQMANVAAIIANRGYYYTPHLLKNLGSLSETPKLFQQKHEVMVDSSNFTPVVEGMQLVYEGEHGSSRWYKIEDIEMCGKTGTAENPHGDDHSVFIAFAPKDNPRIAIAVVVETSGFGATWAAPIASLMIEKYLNNDVKPRWYLDKILNANLLTGDGKD